jgi:murein DD-endopeptidase MepM/ murein hydrolase activator NlpD
VKYDADGVQPRVRQLEQCHITLEHVPDPAHVRQRVARAVEGVPAEDRQSDHGEECLAADEQSAEPQQQPVRKASLPQPQPLTGNEFRWPARGRIISGFGARPDGKHNDGINIAVPLGTSVKAVENGVVAYAGSELEGYGNLVLIRHADDWVSAYAHNDEILVKRGDGVRRGQIIAKAGKSGTVSQPQVHFELRKGSQPVDPLDHLAETS